MSNTTFKVFEARGEELNKDIFRHISFGEGSFQIVEKMEVPHVDGILFNEGYVYLAARTDTKYNSDDEGSEYHSTYASSDSAQRAREEGWQEFDKLTTIASSTEKKISMEEHNRNQDIDRINYEMDNFSEDLMRKRIFLKLSKENQENFLKKFEEIKEIFDTL